MMWEFFYHEAYLLYSVYIQNTVCFNIMYFCLQLFIIFATLYSKDPYFDMLLISMAFV